MESVEQESLYCIFMNGGDEMFVIGKTGQYETELSKAMLFTDKLDAIIYVEKHGYERLAKIRKVKF